jgi:hypothetical protein
MEAEATVPATVHITLTFTVPHNLTQENGQALWAKADHFVRKGPGVYVFSTSLDHDHLAYAIDDVSRWIQDQVPQPVSVIGVEASFTDEVPK